MSKGIAAVATTVCFAGVASIVLLVYSRSQKRKDPTENSHDEAPKPPNVPVSLSHSLPQHVVRALHKEEMRQQKIPFLARKSPMYDNILMKDPQGETLCTVSRKKATWYVHKGLAQYTSPEQDCIQLAFEPRERSNRGELGTFVKSPKQNICVVCGKGDHLMRHYVVPYAYRSLFPPCYKSHLSHDIVILCPRCHLHCEEQTQRRMKQLEDNAGIPDHARLANRVDANLQQVRSAALALMRWKHKLPLDKVMEYDQLIRSHLRISDQLQQLSKEQLQQAIDVEYRIPNPHYVSGPEGLVQSLNGDDDRIESFILDWRQHFCETLQPRHLPRGWGVYNPVTSDNNSNYHQEMPC